MTDLLPGIVSAVRLPSASRHADNVVAGLDQSGGKKCSDVSGTADDHDAHRMVLLDGPAAIHHENMAHDHIREMAG